MQRQLPDIKRIFTRLINTRATGQNVLKSPPGPPQEPGPEDCCQVTFTCQLDISFITIMNCKLKIAKNRVLVYIWSYSGTFEAGKNVQG